MSMLKKVTELHKLYAQIAHMARDTMTTNSMPMGGMTSGGIHDSHTSEMGNIMHGTMNANNSSQMGNTAPA